MDTKIVLIILSAIVGILIGQTNGALDRRNNKRKALNKALSELLEIRHSFRASMYVMQRLAKDLQLPFGLYDEIFSEFPDELFWNSSISTRYNDAVDAISEYDPLLAYMLRSKDVAGIFCGGGSPITFGSTKESHNFALNSLSTIESVIVPSLEKAIFSVASIIGGKQKADIAKVVAESKNISPEMVQKADKVIATAQQFLANEQNMASIGEATEHS